jgi:Uma2 family endonuclease
MAVVETLGPGSPAPEALEVPRPRRWTRAEYYRLAEIGLLRSNERTELLDGEIVVMPPQRTAHFTSVCLAYAALHRHFHPTHLVRQQGPLTLGESTEPEPDLAEVPGSARDYEQAHPGTAALVVEVSDTTLRYDAGPKSSLYARAGVPELWIIDLVQRRVEVRRDPIPMPGEPYGHGYRTVSRHLPGEWVSPLAAPAAQIEVNDLLPGATEESHL